MMGLLFTSYYINTTIFGNILGDFVTLQEIRRFSGKISKFGLILKYL